MASPASAAADTETFSFTGTAQTFTVPAGVTEVTIDAYGAAGGPSEGGAAPGGLGGRATATIPVTPGEALAVYVGGLGTAPGSRPAFNGGGAGADTAKPTTSSSEAATTTRSTVGPVATCSTAAPA